MASLLLWLLSSERCTYERLLKGSLSHELSLLTRLSRELVHTHVLVRHRSSLTICICLLLANVRVEVGHSSVATDRHELEIVTEALFIGNQVFHRFLVLDDKLRLCVAVLLVLDELSEIDHESPGVGSQCL